MEKTDVIPHNKITIMISHTKIYFIIIFIFIIDFSRQGFTKCSSGCLGTHSVDQAGTELKRSTTWYILRIYFKNACGCKLSNRIA